MSSRLRIFIHSTTIFAQLPASVKPFFDFLPKPPETAQSGFQGQECFAPSATECLRLPAIVLPDVKRIFLQVLAYEVFISLLILNAPQ
jgi:hypothetical protein